MADQEYSIGIDWSSAIQDTESFISRVQGLADEFAGRIGSAGASTSGEINRNATNFAAGGERGVAELTNTGLFTEAQIGAARVAYQRVVKAMETSARHFEEIERTAPLPTPQQLLARGAVATVGDAQRQAQQEAQSAFDRVRRSFYGSLGGQAPPRPDSQAEIQARRDAARTAAGGAGGRVPPTTPRATGTSGEEEVPPEVQAIRNVFERLKRAQIGALEAQVYRTQPGVFAQQAQAGGEAAAGVKIRQAAEQATSSAVLAADEDYHKNLGQTALNQKLLAEATAKAARAAEEQYFTSQGTTLLEHEVSTSIVKLRDQEEQKLALNRAILEQHERALAGERSLVSVQAENAAVTRQIAAERKRVAQQEFAQLYGPGGTAPAGEQGTFYQRLQARLQVNRGGELRAPTSFQTGGQFVASKALTTLGFLGPGILAYGAYGQLRQAVEEAGKLQESLNELKASLVATDHAGEFPEFRKALLDIANKTGTLPDEVARIGLVLHGAFGTGQEGQDAVDVATKLTKLGDLDPQEVSNQLVSIGQNFGDSAKTIGDAVITIRDRFSVAIPEAVKFLGDLAPAAKAAGFSLQDLVAVAGVANKYTGRGAASVAEGLGRVLPALHDNLIPLLQVPGVKLDKQAVAQEDTREIFLELIRQANQLSPQSRQSVVSLLGGGRQSQLLDALFGHADEVVGNLKKPFESGALDAAFAARMKALSEQVNRFKVALAELAGELLRSGLAKFFTDVISAGAGLVQLLVKLVELFDSLPKPVKETAVELFEVVTALKALQLLSAAKVFFSGVAGGGAGGLLGRVLGTAAPAAETAAASGGLSGISLLPAGFSLGTLFRRGFTRAAPVSAAERAAGASIGEVFGPGGQIIAPEAVAGGGLFAATGILPPLAVGFGLNQIGQIPAVKRFGADYFHAGFGGGTPAQKPGQPPPVPRIQGIPQFNDKDYFKNLSTYYRETEDQLSDQALKRIADQQKYGFSLKSGHDEKRHQVNTAINEARSLLGKRYESDPTTKAQAEDAVKASQEIGKITATEADKLINELDHGDYKAYRTALDLLAQGRKSGGAKFKSAFAKFQASSKEQRQATQASSALEALGTDKELFASGDLSYDAYLSEIQGQIKTLQGYIKGGNQDPAFAKALADLQKEQSNLVSTQVKAALGFASRLRTGLGTEDPQAAVNAALVVLRTPGVSGAERSDAALDALDALQKDFQNRLSNATSLAQKLRISQAGFEIPPDLRAALIQGGLDQNVDQAGLQAGANELGISVDAYKNEILAEITAFGQTGKQIQLKLLNAQKAIIEKEISQFGPGGGLGQELASVNAAIDAVNTEPTDTVDPGSKAAGQSPEEQAKLKKQHDDALRDATDQLRLARAANQGAVANARIKEQIARAKIAAANAIGDDVAATQAEADLINAQESERQGLIELRNAQDAANQAHLRYQHNDVGAAQAAYDEAVRHVSEATNDTDRANAEAGRWDALSNLVNTRLAHDDALANLRESVARVNGDLVGALRDQLANVQEHIKELVAAGATPATSNELVGLQAQAVSLGGEIRDQVVADKVRHADFLHEVGQISAAQEAAMLRNILASAEGLKLTGQEREDILRQIHSLTHGSDLQFDIPTNLDLPNLYQSRRLVQTSRAGQSYLDNRQVNITLNAYNATDYQGAINKTLDTLAAPSRFGTRPGLY